MVFDCDLKSLQEFNQSSSLRAKKLQSALQNVNASPAPDQYKSTNMGAREYDSAISNNNMVMKSARSFTQYKDFEVEKDKKNMTVNFTYGPQAL